MYTHNKAFYAKCLKMNIFQIIFVCTFTNIFAAPQLPQNNSVSQAEIPDQFEKQPEKIDTSTMVQIMNLEQSTINPEISPDTITAMHDEIHELIAPNAIKEIFEDPPFSTKLYAMVTIPLKRFIATPKVNTVLRNIGTCVVNGAMEIISHFFPTPLMPLIASAAGMIIPFEPVVMLKERMPVTSYRRAIKTAVNSFMDTFDEYKVDKEEDPYMTRQFYRRFMNDDDDKKKKVKS